MVNVKCTLAPREFETGDVTEAIAVALLAKHGISHQTPNQSTAPTAPPPPQAPKLDRPTVDIGVTIEEWNAFVQRWEVFRQGSSIDERAAPAQLFQCAGQELGDSLLKVDPKALSIPLKQLLAKLRSLAMIPVAISVLRTELLQLRQERRELFRAFATRVRGKAETCAYVMACTCGQSVDYTDQMIRDVLLNGINDSDIRRDVLGTRDILNSLVNELISIVESKEIAQNATPSPSNLSAVSMFRKQRALHNTMTTGPSEADKSKTASYLMLHALYICGEISALFLALLHISNITCFCFYLENCFARFLFSFETKSRLLNTVCIHLSLEHSTRCVSRHI